MIFRLQSYLLFLFKSTNAHGIHSPFIYSYLTKCLYKKPRSSKDKVKDVLFKSIAHFKVQKINVIGNKALQNELKMRYPSLLFETCSIDLLYVEDALQLMPDIHLISNKVHNDSLIMIDGIYNGPKYLKQWRRLCQNPMITASIDFYHCGVLFVRKEGERTF
ncbi:MAG: hypothetical protein KJN65_00380 [Croceitalea sp.]|nr:hypothetical protein [Croceitalea sp.]